MPSSVCWTKMTVERWTLESSPGTTRFTRAPCWTPWCGPSSRWGTSWKATRWARWLQRVDSSSPGETWRGRGVWRSHTGTFYFFFQFLLVYSFRMNIFQSKMEIQSGLGQNGCANAGARRATSEPGLEVQLSSSEQRLGSPAKNLELKIWAS